MKPVGYSSDTHWTFEHIIEIIGRLSLAPQRFSKLNSSGPEKISIGA